MRKKNLIGAWLITVAACHKRKISQLDYIFVSDSELLLMNKNFLGHNYFTDVITFDYSTGSGMKNLVSGEIYISVDRVKENASKYKIEFHEELHRVMAHGLLHLCGLRDKSLTQVLSMRNAEEKALVLRKF
ncbi:MAG: rRNA maturation RNase YbeY [Bacteroidetes bacterium]|nr:rRNA maturation RNase YbeY [Bacteroidota bacterium]